MGAFSQGPGGPGLFVGGNLVAPHMLQEFYVERSLRGARYVISGQTQTLNGVALAGCTVNVYETIRGQNLNEPKGRLVGSAVSDSLGNYTVDVYTGPNATFQAEAYLAGTTDLAGITVNTLVGTSV